MECRLCVKGSPVVCIFKIESRFLDNIIALFKISPGDALPDMICVDCLQQLKSIEDFLKICEESDQTLRSKLISGIKQEPDVHIWDYLDSPPCEVKDDTNIPYNCLVSEEFVTRDFIEEEPSKQAYGDRHLTKENGVTLTQGSDVTLTQGSDTSAVVPHLGHSEPNSNLTESGTSIDFTCAMCQMQFSSNQSLKAHIYVHIRRPTSDCVECIVCSETYVSNERLAVHFTSHSDVKLFVCRYCPNTFTDNSLRSTHELSHRVNMEMPTRFTCTICGTNCQHFTDHMRPSVLRSFLIHNENIYKGSQVYNFILQLLKKDRKNINKKNNNDEKQAHDVNNISTCDTNIDKSMDESNDTSMLKSDDEDFFSNNYNDNINHKVKPQNKKNNIDKRESIDKSVNDLSDTSTSGRDDYFSSDNDCVTNYNNGSTKKLVNNKQNNHKSKSNEGFKKRKYVGKKNNTFKSYLCAMCGIYIKNIFVHRRHFVKHSDSPKHIFKCEECGKTFNLEQDMKNHANRVHLFKFKCKVCKRKFKYSFSAVLHELRKHRNVEVHKCIVCGKVSKSKELLQVHMNIHTRIPYNAKCELCNKFYIDKQNMRRHMARTHTDVRAYKCAHCPKDFKTFKHKKRHEMLHTGETPYKCPVCPKAYNQKNNMKSHFVHNHKELDYNTEMDKFIQLQKSTTDKETC